MLRLVEVDRYNFRSLIDLEVTQEQQNFIVPNAYSLAQAYAQPECIPLGIYCGNVPVGFAMYCIDRDDHAYWIYRLMIDQRFQHQGYGQEALRLLIRYMAAEEPDRRVIYLSFEPGNKCARRLYEKLGFVPDGRMLYGETVYKLELRA